LSRDRVSYLVSIYTCTRGTRGTCTGSPTLYLTQHRKPNIRKQTPGFPVAEHFSSGGHSIRDIRVRGFKLCHGSALKRKQTEMELIYKLGTLECNLEKCEIVLILNSTK